MAAVPQLETCCCGRCALRTGSLIILWLYLIIGVLYMLGPTIPAGYVSPSQNSTSPSGTSSAIDANPMDHYPASVMVTLGLISAIVAGCGLYGVYKVYGTLLVSVSLVEARLFVWPMYGIILASIMAPLKEEIAVYLVPFLIWELVQVIILNVITLFISFGVIPIVATVISFLIAFYFWLIVFSHYRVLKGSVRGTQA